MVSSMDARIEFGLAVNVIRWGKRQLGIPVPILKHQKVRVAWVV